MAEIRNEAFKVPTETLISANSSFAHILIKYQSKYMFWILKIDLLYARTSMYAQYIDFYHSLLSL